MRCGRLERHLEGRRFAAVVLGVLACLLRPELFLFVGPYALWVFWVEPALRWRVAFLLALLPALWIVPEWIGSGAPLDGGRQATSEPSWSLSLVDQPWLAALERAHRIAGLPLELGALAGAIYAVLVRDRALLVITGAAVSWVALYAGMTQVGFSGNARYVLPAFVLMGLLAGVGTAKLIEGAAALAGRLGRVPRLAGGLAAAALLCVAVAPEVKRSIERMDRQASAAAEMAGLQKELAQVVQAAGGAQ